MAYLNCGRCGLEIKIQAGYLQIANCPRCLARSAAVVPLTLSPNGVITAAGSAGRPRQGRLADAAVTAGLSAPLDHDGDDAGDPTARS